jgi:membrane-associated protein
VRHHVEALAGAPWILVIVFGVAALDALLPFMPSETTVVAVAVGTATVGRPGLLAMIAVAAAGAFAGDQLGYLLGRRAVGRVTTRLDRHRRSRTVREWAARLMATRGGVAIVVGRYLPGGRSVTAFTAGFVRYPATRFAAYTALAVLLWATQAALTGYLGGAVFADRPLMGAVVAAVAVALGVSVFSAIRRLRASPSAARRTPTTMTCPGRDVATIADHASRHTTAHAGTDAPAARSGARSPVKSASDGRR